MTRLRHIRLAGFTLIELIIAIVILSIGATAFVTLIINAVRNSVDPVIRQQANAVAEAYMEEILLKPFCDPDFDPDSDPATGCSVDCTVAACSTSAPNACGGANTASGAEANRALFDDVCDYNGLPPDNRVRDQLGNLISGLEPYRVNVSVVDGPAADLDSLAGNNGQVVRINVNVQRNNETLSSLSSYKANF